MNVPTNLQTRVPEGTRPRLDLCLKCADVAVANQASFEILQLFPLLLLDLEGYLAAPIQEERNLFEVLYCAAPSRHRGRSDPDATRRQSRRIAMHSISVQGNRADLTHLFNLGARQAVRPNVPQHQVVVSPIAGEL